MEFLDVDLGFRRGGHNVGRRSLGRMNLKSVIVMLAAVIAGTFGGAMTYQVAVPAGNAQPGNTESIVLKSPGDKQRARQQQRRVRFAPCKPPAKLEGKRCVTDVVRTVVVDGRPAAQPVAQPVTQSAPRTASAPVAPAPAPASSPGSDWNDDGRDGYDDSGHGGDDDDDNSGPGGDDDDDSHTGTHTGTHTQTRSHD